mgnify:CR=1 FL=1
MGSEMCIRDSRWGIVRSCRLRRNCRNKLEKDSNRFWCCIRHLWSRRILRDLRLKFPKDMRCYSFDRLVRTRYRILYPPNKLDCRLGRLCCSCSSCFRIPFLKQRNRYNFWNRPDRNRHSIFCSFRHRRSGRLWRRYRLLTSCRDSFLLSSFRN